MIKFLRDIIATLVAGVGMVLFLAGGGFLMVAVLINGSDDLEVDVDLNSRKVPVSPLEKQGEN